MSKPLLTITLDDINSVPVVHYNGEEITRKIRVTFDWETSMYPDRKSTYIKIEHADTEHLGHTKTVQYNEPI